MRAVLKYYSELPVSLLYSSACCVQEKELNSAYARVVKLEQQLANPNARFHVSFPFPAIFDNHFLQPAVV